MHYDYITTRGQLLDFCDAIAAEPVVAFDTEFVSEDSYRPDLCLVQVAAGERLAVIDPRACEDVTPFWELLVAPGRMSLVHAGREEFRFCLAATGQRPHNLFDVQIAAGLVGLEYPAAYGTLISKLLRKSLTKGETRTDWRRRPLSATQIEYALQDVMYLEPLRQRLQARLEKFDRTAWMATEMQAWQDEVAEFEASEQWRRVSGMSNLSPRSLAVVREVWRWRDAEARRRNSPPRRVLRDDLIIELARRQTSDVKRIRALRGLERRELQKHLTDIAECVSRALALPTEDCPQPLTRTDAPHLSLIGQFFTTALSSICRSAHVAPSIVGTASDVRELIAWRLGLAPDSPPPALASGWREQVVGHVIEELLEGRLSIRIADPLSDHPLVFEPTVASANEPAQDGEQDE